MSDADWVLLVECHDVAELHALRATLESGGVPCRIEGEHTHGIMGAFHGAAVRSRVLVPRRALAVARTMVKDIVGPFDDEPSTEDDETRDESPFRRQGPELEESDQEGEQDAPAPRLKSYARLTLVALLVVGPLIGLAHIYAGLNVRAGALALTTLVALPAALGGAPWALLMLVGVWVTDLVGGGLGIAAHNERVQRGVLPATSAGSGP